MLQAKVVANFMNGHILQPAVEIKTIGCSEFKIRHDTGIARLIAKTE